MYDWGIFGIGLGNRQDTGLLVNKQKGGFNMKMRLKKDLVIPAGTMFGEAPTRTHHVGDGHIDHVFGLSDNTHGTVTYCLGDDPDQMGEWFELVESTKSLK